MKKVVLLCIAFVATLAHAQKTACPAVLQHKLPALMSDKPIDLCAPAAKAVLVVNTASRCGFTPQYEGLEQLHKKYSAKGLMVVGVPANDFGQQEAGSNAEIAEFCKANFGVSFAMAEKLTQPIPQTALFKGLASAAAPANAKNAAFPKWNFHKYLIDANGKVQSFSSDVTPMGKELTAAVETALK